MVYLTVQTEGLTSYHSIGLGISAGLLTAELYGTDNHSAVFCAQIYTHAVGQFLHAICSMAGAGNCSMCNTRCTAQTSLL